MFKKSKKILSLFVLLILTFVFLLTATYAWFTKNQEVETSDLSVRVRTSEHMEVSTDAINWSRSLTMYDILHADYKVERFNQVPLNFYPYSSIGEINNGKLNMFFGLVSLDKEAGSPTYMKRVLKTESVSEVDGETGGFLAFDMYFKNNVPRTIYLGRKSYIKPTGEVIGIENAFRVAFVFEGSTLNASDIEYIQSLNGSEDGYVRIWEPNADVHTDTAVLAANKTYGLNISEKSEFLKYYGVKKETITPVLVDSTDPEYFSLMNENICTDANYNKVSGPNKLIFNLPEGISKVRVYVWVEGQDVDCENNAAGTDFELNLNFTTNVEESV